MAEAARAGLGFSLTFAEGRAILAASPRRVGPFSLERLELEVPRIRFPFDVTGGAARFQRRRTWLRAAEITVEEEALQALLARHARLGELGLEAMRLRIRRGRAELAGRARVGGRVAELSARVHAVPGREAGALVASGGGLAEPDPRALVVALSRVQVHGYLGVPAPLIALGLGLAFSAAPPGLEGVVPIGRGPRVSLVLADCFLVHPLRALLLAVLPPLGWRLPDVTGVELGRVELDHGRLFLGFTRPGPLARRPVDEAAAHVLRDVGELRTLATEAELALAAGEAPRALEALRLARAAHPDSAPLQRRHLALAAAGESSFAEVEAEARSLCGAGAPAVAREQAQAALAALVAVADGRQRHRDAARTAAALAAAAEEEGDEESAFAAILAAARFLGRVEPLRAAELLERSAADRRSERAVRDLLAELYEAGGRPADALPLLTRLLAEAAEGADRARLGERLGRVQLQLGDALAAARTLAEAVEHAASPGTWLLLGEAEARRDAPERALAAFEQAARLHERRREGRGQALALLAAAELLAARGPETFPSEATGAGERVRRALGLLGAAPERDRRAEAELRLRAGRVLEGEDPEEALGQYERAFDVADLADAAELRQRAARAAMRACLTALAEPRRAAGWAERLLADLPMDPEAREVHARSGGERERVPDAEWSTGEPTGLVRELARLAREAVPAVPAPAPAVLPDPLEAEELSAGPTILASLERVLAQPVVAGGAGAGGAGLAAAPDDEPEEGPPDEEPDAFPAVPTVAGPLPEGVAALVSPASAPPRPPGAPAAAPSRASVVPAAPPPRAPVAAPPARASVSPAALPSPAPPRAPTPLRPAASAPRAPAAVEQAPAQPLVTTEPAEPEASSRLAGVALAALQAEAEAAYAAEDFDRARELYDELGDRAPGISSVALALRQGELAEICGDLAAAAAAFGRAAERAPTDAEPREALARVALQQGEIEAAAGHLERAHGLAPERPGVVEQLAEAYLALGRGKEAAQALETLARLTSDDPVLRADALARAAAVYRTRAGDRARADDRTLLSWDAETSADLGGAVELGDPEAVAGALRAGLRLLPEERQPPGRLAETLAAIARLAPGEVADAACAVLGSELDAAAREQIAGALARLLSPELSDDEPRRLLGRLTGRR